jgi:3-methyladenine DNA glycosylase/8-oxoguanine DNA glycosylase
MGTEFRPAAAERLAERWRPYRAYAVQHLWARLTAARLE